METIDTDVPGVADRGPRSGLMWNEMSDLMKSSVVMGMQIGRGVVTAWMLQTNPQCRELVNADASGPTSVMLLLRRKWAYSTTTTRPI